MRCLFVIVNKFDVVNSCKMTEENCAQWVICAQKRGADLVIGSRDGI